MKKKDTSWIVRLRSFMEAQGMNPRSLSLKAGLNPTAVRDMLEGRVKFPRYDTVESLARALSLTPAQLMSDEATPSKVSAKASASVSIEENDLDLLTEIITRLQEAAHDYKHSLQPEEFAAMVTTIYRQMKPEKKAKNGRNNVVALEPKIQNLMEYEALRRRAGEK